jgi:hypothetical protein
MDNSAWSVLGGALASFLLIAHLPLLFSNEIDKLSALHILWGNCCGTVKDSKR